MQAHACRHEQEAVPQHPLVVLVLLLPGLGPLWPHTVELGPVLSVGGFPGAAGEQRTVESGLLERLEGKGVGVRTAVLYPCVCCVDFVSAVLPEAFGGLAECSC